jgi:hypothetical protein
MDQGWTMDQGLGNLGTLRRDGQLGHEHHDSFADFVGDWPDGG